MPSFDIVSEVNLQDIDNAVNQCRKELIGRYDFKGIPFEVALEKQQITLVSNDETKVTAMRDIMNTKLFKAGIELGSIEVGKLTQTGGRTVKQVLDVKTGLDKETAKKISQFIKETKIKVDCQIQGDILRVQSKKIDDLQATIAAVKSQSFGLPLQIKNMRS